MARPPLRDDPFPNEWDFALVRMWFLRRLEGHKPKEMGLLGARAASRSLPWFYSMLSQPKTWGKKPAEASLLACLRCYPISLGASLVPPEEIDHFQNIAFVAANNAYPTEEFLGPNSSGARAASSAADAAADSADSARSVASAAAAAADTASAAAFEQDCADIRRVGVEALLCAPLWPFLDDNLGSAYAELFPGFERRGGIPPKTAARWIELRKTLRGRTDDFSVWAEWYEGILTGDKDGSHLFGLPTERALRLNVDFALIDDALWKGEPAKLHAEMRRLIEVARGEGVGLAPTLGAIPPGLGDLYDEPAIAPDLDPALFDQGTEGSRFVEQGDMFVPVFDVNSTDVQACQSSSVSKMHPRIVDAANAFKDIAFRLDNQAGWTGIGAAAERLHAACAVPLEALPEQVELIFESLVEVASFLEFDNALRQPNSSSNADQLTPEYRRPLEHLVRIAAPWARQFPTIIRLDDEAGSFLASPELKLPARAFVKAAQDANVISKATTERILALLDAADRGEFQGQKANNQGVGWAKKLTKAVGLVVAFQMGMVGNEAAPNSVIAKRGAALVLEAESNLLKLAEAVSSDYRLAIIAILDELKKGGGNLPPLPQPESPVKRRRSVEEDEDP